MKKALFVLLCVVMNGYALEPTPNSGTQLGVEDNSKVSVKNAENQGNFLDSFGVGGELSTLGIGFNLSHVLYKDYLDLRFNVNYFTYSSNVSGNPYEVNMNTYGLLLDYKPFGGIFRVSGGLYYDNNNLQLSAGTQSLSLNGQTYNSSQFSNLSSSVNFAPIAPYIGIGFGSTSNLSQDRKGLYFTGDLGVLYSNPTVSINATCTSGTGVDCNSFNSNLSAQKNNIQNILTSYGQFYPVIGFGVGYRF